MNPLKMKKGKPYWKAKLSRVGNKVIIDVERIVLNGAAGYEISRIAFSFPANRKVFKT